MNKFSDKKKEKQIKIIKQSNFFVTNIHQKNLVW